MTLLYNIISIIIGFSSGIIIAGAVFAFISIIGVVPRLAQKTNTQRYVKLYEEAIIVGGILGTSMSFYNVHLPVNSLLVMVLSFCSGIFYGVLAMSLAEILDVIPILTRRGRVQKGMFFFIIAIAIGKLAGSLLYFCVPGFFEK